jgi:hypothetical protein
MNNVVLRGFALFGIFALLAFSFGNCAQPNSILPMDLASADGPCWASGAGTLTEACGDNVGIGTSSPQVKFQVAGGVSNLQQEAWSIPVLENSWTNYGNGFSPASYFKDSLGMVHLRGLVATGTFNACILTLPAGYRPGYHGIYSVRYYLTGTGEGGIRLDVQTTGCVQATSATAAITWLSLENVNFLGEQ